MIHPSTITKSLVPRYGCGDAHADAVRLGVWLPAGWEPRFIDLAVEPDRLSLLGCCSPETRQALLYIRALRRSRRTDRRRLAMFEAGATFPPPDALRTAAEAACKLRCSIKTLDGYVRAGALKYVIIGHGKKRPRKMFTDGDLNAFITHQTRKDVPCPSIVSRVRRSGTSSSESEVIAFTAARRPRPGAKPKK